MASTIKLKNGSGAPTSGQLVQGEPALDLTNKRLYTENASGTVIEVGTNPAAEITANGGIALPDNQKATFGASDDLQIYHDSTTNDSIITESGAGNLVLQGNSLRLTNTSGVRYLQGNSGAEVNLWHNGNKKLETTATGIDVTGTVTADGLTVGSTAGNMIDATTTSAGSNFMVLRNTTDDSRMLFTSSASTNILESALNSTGAAKQLDVKVGVNRISVGTNGDISFYEDTGTTAKFFWDASAEYLSVGGTTGTFAPINYIGSNGRLGINNGNTAGGTKIQSFAATNANGYLAFEGWDKEYMRISSAGNVGIGASSPDTLLHLSDAAGGAVIRLERNDTTIASTDVYGEIQFEGQDASAGSAAGIRGKILGVAEGATGEMALAFQTASGYGSSTERARLDSSGNLLVGTTDTVIYDHTTGEGVVIGPNAIQISRSSDQMLLLNRMTNSGPVAGFYAAGVGVGSITVTGTTTSYLTSSDERLKDNILDAPSASNDIDAIQVRSFDWKADGSHQKYGMVAQELQLVAPEAVSGDADSEEMMGVDYSKLVPMLIKEIQSLRARVAQLEGN